MDLSFATVAVVCAAFEIIFILEPPLLIVKPRDLNWLTALGSRSPTTDFLSWLKTPSHYSPRIVFGINLHTPCPEDVSSRKFSRLIGFSSLPTSSSTLPTKFVMLQPLMLTAFWKFRIKHINPLL